MHRARLWELSDQDLYKKVFVAAHSFSCATWAAKSSRTLQEWGIQDWPSWKSSEVSLDDYKTYVKVCAERASLSVWRQQVAEHVLPIPFLSWSGAPRCDLQWHEASRLSWACLASQRALCRLRAGLLRLGHVSGQRSSARRQACIFCNTFSLSMHFHVMCRCTIWEQQRSSVWNQRENSMPPDSMHDQLAALFCTSPGDESYASLVAWARLLDNGVREFWGTDCV